MDDGRRRHRSPALDCATSLGVVRTVVARHIRSAGRDDAGRRGRDLHVRARHAGAAAHGRRALDVARRQDRVSQFAPVVDCAAQCARHGLVHGDPGPVVGAVVDGDRRVQPQRRGRSSARDGPDHACRVCGGSVAFDAACARRGGPAARLRGPVLVVHGPSFASLLPRHVFAAGFGLQTVVLALIVTRPLPFTYATWALYGLTAAVNILGYTLLNEGFARELAARANTALNLAVFVVSFAMQWGIGLVADAARAVLGVDAAGGLRVAFVAVLCAEALACVWFALGWR